MLLLTPVLIRSGKSKTVFGFSLYSISATYFLIEFVTGILFILSAPENYFAALSVQLCVAGLYGIILVGNMLANEYSAAAEEKNQNEIRYIKDASAKLKSILETISDKEVKKKVERIYDAVYSSPVKSHPNLTQLEKSILRTINELEIQVRADNKDDILSLANFLLTSVDERNNLLKNCQ
jgi:hypothetical protein